MCVWMSVMLSCTAAALGVRRSESGRIVNAHARAEHPCSLQRDAGQTIEMHLAESRQPREEWQTGIGDLQAFVQVNLLQRFHAAENFEARVRDLCQPAIVILDRKPLYVFCRSVAGL